jgi:hypothetical protein
MLLHNKNATLSIGESSAKAETPLTFLLFCKSTEIEDQRCIEERTDLTNQRLLDQKLSL